MSNVNEYHVGIVYGHNEQFNPLFEKLHKKGIDTIQIDPAAQLYDPSNIDFPSSLIFNDLSSPRYLSHHPFFLQQSVDYIKAAETHIIHSNRIVNCGHASEVIVNRSRHPEIFRRLNLRYPKTRLISNTDQLFDSCNELQFPLIIKSESLNDFQKGKRYHSMSEIVNDVINNTIRLHNKSLLIQEFIESKDNAIIKAQVIGGRVTSALKHFHAPDFSDQEQLVVKTELFKLPNALTAAIEQLAHSVRIDAGSITFKYDVNGDVHFIDIGTHTTHLPIPLTGEEFLAVDKLADYLEHRLLTFKEFRLAV